MTKSGVAFFILSAVLLAGCASTRGTSSGQTERAPLSEAEITVNIKGAFGEQVASYLDAPITDEEYLAALRHRAKSFVVKGNAVPFSIESKLVLDLGGDRLNESITAAVVDNSQSADLLKYLSQELKYEATRENTFSAFVTYRYFDAKVSRLNSVPVFGHREFILVNVYNTTARIDESAKFAFYLVDEQGSRELFARTMSPQERSQASNSTVPKTFVPSRSARLMGMFHGALVQKDGEWKWARLKELGTAKETVSRRILGGPVRYTAVDVVEYQSTRTRWWCVFWPFSRLGSCALQLQKLPLMLESRPAEAYAFQAGTIFGGIIGIDERDDSGRTMYGPPNGAGSAGCSGYETTADCKACCTAYQIGAFGAIAGFAAKCHGATCWWCPWCHIGCGAAELAAALVVIWYTDECRDNCGVEYWEQY